MEESIFNIVLHMYLLGDVFFLELNGLHHN
jgi:hypothetical protein